MLQVMFIYVASYYDLLYIYRRERERGERKINIYLLFFFIPAGKDRKRSADDFFNDIMKNTGTVILWPSRLKIGAKSKKGEEGGREGRERGGRIIYLKITDYQNCLIRPTG